MSAPITALPPDCHSKVLQLHDYWRDCKPGLHELPSRRQVDPLRVPKLLENMWLVDVIGRPPRFRFRLIGGAMRRMGIMASPGDFIDRFLPDDAPPVEDLRHVTLNSQPVWFRGHAYMPHEKVLHSLERLFLPMAEDGRNVDVVMALTVFFDANGKEL